MAATEYSLGVDLGRTPSQTAIVRHGDAVTFSALAEVPVGALDAQSHIVHRIAATVAQLVEREGRAPSTIGISVTDDELGANSDLPRLIASHLGLGTDRVRLVGATEAARLGLAHQHPAGSGTDASESMSGAAALGAALSGMPPSIAGPLAAGLAAGLGGALAGGLGAAALAEGATAAPGAAALAGPAGVPIGPSSLAGPTGVQIGPSSLAGPAGVPMGPSSLAGPAGVPMGPSTLAGPTGTPLGSTAGVGPTGTPLGPPPGVAPPTDVPVPPTVGVARRSRIPLIAGAVAVVVVAAGAIAVAAGGGDSPTATPTVAETVAPTPTNAAAVVSVAPASTATPDTAVAASTIPVGTVPATKFVAACVVGSWLADNTTIDSGIFSVLPAEVAGLIEVGASTGTVILDIAADGTLTSTFDKFTVSANLTDGSASVTSTASGTASGTATFADDGSFAGDMTQSDTQMQVTFNAAVVFDGAAPVPVIHGTGTYTCAQDQLQITNPGDPLVATYTRNG